MNYFDLREFQENTLIKVDLCIVGSGPVGLSIAKEFVGTDINVLVVEGGGFETEDETQKLNEIENIGDPRIIDQKRVRRRVLGGSSHVWTGRCAPFDEFDFQHRDWIEYSGWPIHLEELAPYFEKASEYLGLGPHCYDERLWEQFKVKTPLPALDEHLLEPIFWQFSKSPRNPKISVDFGQDMKFPQAANINMLLHANVTHINTNDEGNQFQSIEVSTLEHKKAIIEAKALVLGCGGIENARLLLASNRQVPEGLGNQHDLVGRFLMDHTLCALGRFDPQESNPVRSRFGHYWLDNEDGRHVYLHGVSLSQKVQEEEKLLRCHAFIEEADYPDTDPWTLMRDLKSILKSRQFGAKLFLTIVKILARLGEITRGLNRRLLKHRPQLSGAKTVEIHCMLEQRPDPNSRLRLSPDKVDALGMPLSEIDWKISDLERQTVLKMGDVIAQEFSRLNLPLPQIAPWLKEDKNWRERFTEKSHPTGTTRLSSDPREGVVDTNLQLHGVSGIYIAGSSVFPTAGAANPTLMIVALSLRLANWLKTSQFKPQLERTSNPSLFSTMKASYAKPAIASRSSTLIKIGIVGAGKRISEMHLPILEHLAGHYEIVGFTTQSEQRAKEFSSKTGLSAFSSPVELVRQQRPDFLISAVASHANEAILKDLLELGIPILAETPLAWSVVRGKKIVGRAIASQTNLAVAEQFPYLPIEQFKQKLFDTGVFGEIYGAYNDFSTYRYHGIARLRRYFQGNPIKASSKDYWFGQDPHSKLQPQWANIQWRMGTVTFDTGAVFVHHYSDYYTLSDLCHPQSIRIYGKSGTMVDDDIRFFNQQSGNVETVKAVRRENEAGNLASIEADLPGVGSIVWQNPYAAYPFTDQQIAVATLIDGMAKSVEAGTPPLYTAEAFLTDISIMEAFRYSAQRNGAEIQLPLNEKAQKAQLLVSPHYWRKKLLQ